MRRINSRRDCTPLPSGYVINGGIAHTSQVEKQSMEGLYTPPKWRNKEEVYTQPKWINNSRRKCTPFQVDK